MILFNVQLPARLAHVRCVHSRGDDRIRKACQRIDADMRYHAGVPLLALLRLVHVRIALVFRVPRRRRCKYQGGVENRAFEKDPTLLPQVFAGQRKDAREHAVTLQQTAKLQQCRRVRWLSFDQIHTHNGRIAMLSTMASSMPSSDRPKAVLAQVDAPHQRQSYRRATTLTTVVMRRDQRDQDRPQHRVIQGSQKFFPTRRVIVVGEAGLLSHFFGGARLGMTSIVKVDRV